MSKIVKIAANPTIAKLIDADSYVKNVVHEVLSYYIEGKEFMASFASGHWDGRSSFFTHKTATFPAGFLHLVHSELVSRGFKVQLIRNRPPEPLGDSEPVVDSFGNSDPRYDYQMETVRRLLKHGRIIAQVATGGGKCLGRDTPILMFDGSIKPVQDVQVGELLMGPDSTPRRVLSTCTGRAPLYRVTPTKGDSYVVNNAHILSLKKTCRGNRGKNRTGPKYPKGEIVNINVERYLSETKTFRHTHKGWRAGVDFLNSGPLAVDPYFLGLLLGDGSVRSTVSLTSADPEIVAEIERQADLWGLKVTTVTKRDNAASSYYLTKGRTGPFENPLMATLRSYGLDSGEKFIPELYKTASRKDRLQLLAGILDTDGFYDGKGFYLTLKSERLMDDVIFVARSLGFAAYKRQMQKTCCNNGKVGTYFSICLSGALETIPVRLERRKAAPRAQKKDPLVVGLKVEPIGEGDYFGFEIDGDNLFMLGDFTVTHNTKIAKLCVARIKRMTLFVTTRGVLMHQMKESFETMGHTVGVLGDGVWDPRRGINVAMVQTLVARLKETSMEIEINRLVEQRAKFEESEILKYTASTTRMKRSKAALAAGLTELRERLKKSRPGDEAIVAEAKKRVDEQTIIRARTVKLLEMVEFVIGEEAHEAGGNSYYEILRHCKNAHYRLALTATPFMRSDTEDNMRLMAAFGPIGIQVSEKELIDKGILATPSFKYERVPPPRMLYKTTSYDRAYRIGIVENEARNAVIVEHARKAALHGLPVMILVQRKQHGKLLRDKLQTLGLKCSFILGESTQPERQKALENLGAGKIDVLIGTTILDVGVDVPAVGMVILAGGGKAEVALRQRVGRGLRSKKSGPNVAFILDFEDELNTHLRDHARQRRAIIESTPGFVENILAPTEDFDWSLFKRKAA